MKTIRALVNHDERNNRDHYEIFEIWSRLPEIGDKVYSGQFEVKEARACWLDCEAWNKNADLINYDFYMLTLEDLLDDEDDAEWTDIYIAVMKEDEDC